MSSAGGVDPHTHDLGAARITKALVGWRPAGGRTSRRRVRAPGGGGAPEARRRATANPPVRGCLLPGAGLVHDRDPLLELVHSEAPGSGVSTDASTNCSRSASLKRIAMLRGASSADAIEGHRGAVGDDLGELLTDLGGVEADGDRSVGTEQARILDHPIDRVPATVLEQLGVFGYLAAAKRLERCGDAAGESHAANHESVADAQVCPNPHARKLKCRRHREVGRGGGPVHGCNVAPTPPRAQAARLPGRPGSRYRFNGE